jgi:hypothetical protein
MEVSKRRIMQNLYNEGRIINVIIIILIVLLIGFLLLSKLSLSYLSSLSVCMFPFLLLIIFNLPLGC